MKSNPELADSNLGLRILQMARLATEIHLRQDAAMRNGSTCPCDSSTCDTTESETLATAGSREAK